MLCSFHHYFWTNWARKFLPIIHQTTFLLLNNVLLTLSVWLNCLFPLQFVLPTYLCNSDPVRPCLFHSVSFRLNFVHPACIFPSDLSFLRRWESELSICGATSFWSYFFIPNTHILPRSQVCWPQVWLLSIPACWRPIYTDICQEKHENMVIKVPKTL